MSQDTAADALLRSGYQRWLRLEEAKADISEDLKQLFIELKGNGLDTKALRVSFRRVRDADSAEVAEQEALVSLYVASLTRDTRVRARENIEEFGADVVLTDHIDGDGNRLVVTVDSRVAAILNRVEPKLDTPEHDAETGEILGESTTPKANVSAALSAEMAPVVTAPIPQVGGDTDYAGSGLNACMRGEVALAAAPSARLKTLDEVADDMGLPLDPHPSCRKPKICGRFSHKSLCAICRGEQAHAA